MSSPPRRAGQRGGQQLADAVGQRDEQLLRRDRLARPQQLRDEPRRSELRRRPGLDEFGQVGHADGLGSAAFQQRLEIAGGDRVVVVHERDVGAARHRHARVASPPEPGWAVAKAAQTQPRVITPRFRQHRLRVVRRSVLHDDDLETVRLEGLHG
jgi:hypothetical protein